MIRLSHLRKVRPLKVAATALLEAELHIFDGQHVRATMVDPMPKAAEQLFEQKRVKCQLHSTDNTCVIEIEL
jgi:hypothetical protein